MNIKEVKQLVFKGGGAKGLAYLGALVELEKHVPLSQIESFAGTSAGAITAMLLAFGKTTHQLTAITTGIKWSEWLDDEFGVVRDLHNLRTQLGWCRSEVPKKWIRQQVQNFFEYEDATFHDLQEKTGVNLVVCAFNVSRGIPVFFGHDPLTRDVPIWKAVLASMSIPMVWEPVEIMGDQYCDGGGADNFPIHLWDTPTFINPTTLGFWVDDAKRIQWMQGHVWPPSQGIEKNIVKYALRLVTGVTNAEAFQHVIEGRDKFRTVYIDTETETLDLDLSQDEIKDMIEDGKRGFGRFLVRNSTPDTLSINSF